MSEVAPEAASIHAAGRHTQHEVITAAQKAPMRGGTLLVCAAYAHASYLGTGSFSHPRQCSSSVSGRCGNQLRRRSPVVNMGVSDRTANDGLLYDGWGAEGMRMLNSTAKLQERAVDKGISHYDAVLIVAARAKENAYQTAEDQPGYIGNSFDGPMGSGLRRPPPAKSQVMTAIEELNEEYNERGGFPELVTPGIPDELLEMMAAESAAEASAKLKKEREEARETAMAAKIAKRDADELAAAEKLAAAGGADVSAELLDQLLAEEEAEPLGVPAAVPAAGSPRAAGGEEEEDDEEAADPLADEEDKGAVELLSELLGETAVAEAGMADDVEEVEEDDFDDDLDLAGDGGLADLFSDLSMGDGDGSIEAGGMSPGDNG